MVIMKKYIFLVVVLFAFIDSKSQTLEDANNYYKNGYYKKAVEVYESILSQDLESSSLYYNLANSYYKINKVAPAILNYERALLLKPNDRDIKYNLRMSRSLVTDKIEEIPVFFLNRWMEGLVMLFISDTWAILSILAFALMLFFIVVFFFSSSRRLKKITFCSSVFLFLFTVSSFIFSYSQKNRLTERKEAIIFAPSATIKGSPDISGTELFILHEGTKVRVIESLGDWTNIQLSDGNEGWLKSKLIEVI